MIRRVRAAILTAIVLSTATSTGAAAERYYVLIFGSQSHPKLLHYTHTWATFVRAVGEGPDPNEYVLYPHTISWIPQTLEVRVWSPLPEPGVNLDLYQTLAAVSAHHQRVTLWGPLVITPEIYARSLRISRLLRSGIVQYRAIAPRPTR